MRSYALAAVLALAAIDCGGSATAPASASSAPPSSTATLRADATDPAGDTVVDARVPIAPDLVEAAATVSGGNITFAIRLAPGTLDRQTTRVSILLDTDQSQSTGIGQQDGIGADYGIDLAAATGQATITKGDAVACAANQSCFNPIGAAVITLTADTLRVTVPLSVLGNDDGRMNFQTSTYVLVSTLNPVVVDYLPDIVLAPERVQ